MPSSGAERGAGRRPVRRDGFAPIADYAAIGDGLTVALVAADGSIDWLCLPHQDSPSLFGALLDPDRGGRFAIAPRARFTAERRYLPGTNVLETTFRTAAGTVRVTDGMSRRAAGPPWQALIRRVESLAGSVPMRLELTPRPRYGQRSAEWRRGEPGLGFPLERDRHVALCSFDAGQTRLRDGSATSSFTMEAGGTATVTLISAAGPIPRPSREEVERHLDDAADSWRRWSAGLSYEGPWQDAVTRSALALKLLEQPSGAITAAPTTGLPERPGGERNFDYRYSWPRDHSFTIDAFMRIGRREEAQAALGWMLQAAGGDSPLIRPIYQADGSVLRGQRSLDLRGYLDSRPVREGNGAATQLQLGNWGDLLETAWIWVREGNELSSDGGARLADAVDLLVRLWPKRDSGIWELSDRRAYTISKLGSWAAFDRALRLAQAGQVPADSVPRWRTEAARVREYVERNCWSAERGTYIGYAGSDGLDASTLIAARMGYPDATPERIRSTARAVREELGHGPYLYRYTGMQDQEGAFLACSFWLVEALAKTGETDEAAALMDQLVASGNDVGLLSEEIDPTSGELLGNFPQALTHLALVTAAHAVVGSRPNTERLGRRRTG